MQYLTFVFLLILPFCFAQECKNGCAAGLSTCSGINYQLYINGSSHEDIVAIEASVTKLVYEMEALYDFECSAYLQVFMCNALHPACDSSNPSPTPAAPCISMCNDLETYCGRWKHFLPPIVAPFLDCSGVNPATGLPRYSNSTSCSSVNSTESLCPGNPAPVVLPLTGACQPFNPALVGPEVTSVCSPFITKNVWTYVDWPSIQAYAAAQLLLYGDFDTLQNAAKPVFPFECYTRVIGNLCQEFFSACQEVHVPAPYNTTTSIYPYLCVNLCEGVNSACQSDLLSSLNSVSDMFRFNCSRPYRRSVSTYEVEITDDFTFTGNCYPYLFPPDAYAPYEFVDDVVCPTSTGKKSKVSDDEPLCSLRCPDASYTDSEWERLVVITKIGASLSLIAMSFLIISYIVQFERRQFPVVLHIWEFVATGCFALSFLIGGSEPQKDTWCFDEGTYATQDNNTTCAVQGFFFIFFGISLSLWCAIIAFTMFYGIVLNQKVKQLRTIQYILHILGWGIPMAFAVTAVATHSIGYGPPLAWCFIHFAGFGYGSGGLSRDYPLFYIPEGVLFFVILTLFVATVWMLIHKSKTLKVSSAKIKTHARTLRAQVRLLIFIFTVGIICFSIFEWRLQIDGDNITSVVGIEWTYCKIFKELGLPTEESCDGDVNPSRINYTHTAFESFLLSGIGLLIFLGFGSDLSLYKHWLKIFSLIYAREWELLNQMVLRGVDPFPSSTVSPHQITDRSNITSVAFATTSSSTSSS